MTQFAAGHTHAHTHFKPTIDQLLHDAYNYTHAHIIFIGRYYRYRYDLRRSVFHFCVLFNIIYYIIHGYNSSLRIIDRHVTRLISLNRQSKCLWPHYSTYNIIINIRICLQLHIAKYTICVMSTVTRTKILCTDLSFILYYCT